MSPRIDASILRALAACEGAATVGEVTESLLQLSGLTEINPCHLVVAVYGELNKLISAGSVQLVGDRYSMAVLDRIAFS